MSDKAGGSEDGEGVNAKLHIYFGLEKFPLRRLREGARDDWEAPRKSFFLFLCEAGVECRERSAGGKSAKKRLINRQYGAETEEARLQLKDEAVGGRK